MKATSITWFLATSTPSDMAAFASMLGITEPGAGRWSGRRPRGRQAPASGLARTRRSAAPRSAAAPPPPPPVAMHTWPCECCRQAVWHRPPMGPQAKAPDADDIMTPVSGRPTSSWQVVDLHSLVCCRGARTQGTGSPGLTLSPPTRPKQVHIIGSTRRGVRSTTDTAPAASAGTRRSASWRPSTSTSSAGRPAPRGPSPPR